MNAQGIGASVRRKEDIRLLTGAGTRQDTVWYGNLRIALARGGRFGSPQGDRNVVSKGKKIAARAGCPRKPLPPRRRRSPPATIRDSRDCGSR
jgi:hypothetical protein